MQSNPGPRPTVGSHSAIETVISGAYARDEKRVMRTNEERLWFLVVRARNSPSPLDGRTEPALGSIAK